MVEANERSGRVRQTGFNTFHKDPADSAGLTLPDGRFGPRRPFGRQRDKELLKRGRQQSVWVIKADAPAPLWRLPLSLAAVGPTAGDAGSRK